MSSYHQKSRFRSKPKKASLSKAKASNKSPYKQSTAQPKPEESNSSLVTSGYSDPILDTFSGLKNVEDDTALNLKEIYELTKTFSERYSSINKVCHKSLKTYKNLIKIVERLTGWEFKILQTSINLNFKDSLNNWKFDVSIAKACIDKSLVIDEDLTGIENAEIKVLKAKISKFSIDEYLSDPGCLVLKIYFKILNLKSSTSEKLSIIYTKAKLLIIFNELSIILENLQKEEENMVVPDNTDYQSTLNSYKNFVSTLIGQLDQAVLEKDSSQIDECLEILKDVEKMYESVRINFWIEEEINEWEEEEVKRMQEEEEERQRTRELERQEEEERRQEEFKLQDLKRQEEIRRLEELKKQDEEERRDFYKSPSSSRNSYELTPEDYYSLPHHRHRRDSLDSETSSNLTRTFTSNTTTTTTITDELPYLLQAFDEARQLEQEVSSFQNNQYSKPTPRTKRNSTLNPKSSFAQSPPAQSIHGAVQRKSPLTAGLQSNIGFSNNLLNSIYGLHPRGKELIPSKLHNEVD